MPRGIRGVTVLVKSPVRGALDRFGNESTAAIQTEQVDNVLVSPAGTVDFEPRREDGERSTMQLHFPRGYQRDLKGCAVVLPEPWGGEYRVVGQPEPYIAANTPTPWNLPVTVEASHG